MNFFTDLKPDIGQIGWQLVKRNQRLAAVKQSSLDLGTWRKKDSAFAEQECGKISFWQKCLICFQPFSLLRAYAFFDGYTTVNFPPPQQTLWQGAKRLLETMQTLIDRLKKGQGRNGPCSFVGIHL